jgi:hypothetical protein
MTALVEGPDASSPDRFPDSDAGPSMSAPIRWALIVGFVLVATVVQLSRQTGEPLVDTMWAEDGHIFLTEAIENPSPVLVADPAGPLHASARLVAMVAALVPIHEAAMTTRVLAALTVSLLAAYTFFASRELIPSWVGRAALAVLTAALPSAGLETNASTTNLHWYFFVPCFLALLHRPRTRAEEVAAWFVIVVGVLSEGIVLLLAPMALYRVWKPEARGDRARGVTFVALCLVQLAVIVTDNGDGAQESLRYGGPVIYEAIPGLYGMRVVAPLIIGEKGVSEVVGRFDIYPGRLAAAVTVVFAIALVAYIWWGRRDLPRRGWLIIALVYSGAVYLSSTVGRGNTKGILPTADGYVTTGARYMLVPTLLLGLVVIALLSQRDPRVPPWAWSALQVVALVAASVIVVANLRMDTPASDGPTWSEEVQVTKEFCEETGVEEADVRIAPRFLPWVVVVPCDDLD